MADDALLESLQQQKDDLTQQAQTQIGNYLDAKSNLSSILNSNGSEEEIASADQAVADAKALVDETKDQIKQVDQQIATTTDPPVTNLSESEVEAALRQQTSEVVGDNQLPSLGSLANGAINAVKSAVGGALGGAAGLFGKVLFGAIKPNVNPGAVNFYNVNGDLIQKDTRVKIQVPDQYWSDITAGPFDELVLNKGIIFPYTPAISYENKAEYTPVNPVHSNFTQYFYKNSSVSPIRISGKFTVQNDRDAAVYLSTVHLLKALTKMRSGGLKVDALSGSPPPVCRLFAYGLLMIENVPIVINSFQLELPDNVDYYTLGKSSGSAYSIYETNAVPIISTITLNCYPIYSRNEMQKFNVKDFVGSTNSRKSGYL